MSHEDEVITDVTRRRIRAQAGHGRFTIAWDYPGRTLLEVRILRSYTGPASSAEDGLSQGQEIVYQDVTGSYRDAGLDVRRQSFYTVFARHPGGEWVCWGEYEAPGRRESAVRRCLRRLSGGRRGRGTPAVLAVLAVFVLAVLAAPVVAASGSGDQGASGGGKDSAEQSGAGAAIAAARADATVAPVLQGKDATAEATPWHSQGEPGGYTCLFRWPATQAASISGEWPLLRTGNATPEAPYESVLYRLRAGDLTGLRVDVAGSAVVQIMPVDGETDFTLYEETWAPLSWIPWFTQRPWVLAPAFIGVAVLLMIRAWRRSRAWNRRLPSMTRHDRQFIARVVVLLFLLAGFAWQIYQGWYAATGPSMTGSPAGDLTALPMILIPPALFVAGLVLELSPAPHRGSWALLAVLAGATSVYYLATAVIGTTTNLNLGYYILLAILALISVPRAFSSGKMGWSRSHSIRYG